jgi:hypothetical protein
MLQNGALDMVIAIFIFKAKKPDKFLVYWAAGEDSGNTSPLVMLLKVSMG